MGEVKKTRVTSYIPKDIADALKQKADKEYRTVSNLAASILIDYVRDNLLSSEEINTDKSQ